MEDANYPSIPIWVGVRILIFATKDHEVGVLAYVKGILIAAHIVCRVVDTECLVLVDHISPNDDLISLSR